MVANSFSTNSLLRKLAAMPCSQEGVAGPILSQFSFRARQCAQLWHFVTCYLWCWVVSPMSYPNLQNDSSALLIHSSPIGQYMKPISYVKKRFVEVIGNTRCMISGFRRHVNEICDLLWIWHRVEWYFRTDVSW